VTLSIMTLIISIKLHNAESHYAQCQFAVNLNYDLNYSLNVMTHSIMTISITDLIVTLSIMTISITDLIVTLSIKDIQHNDTHHKH
jgi:hypothetical protein